jgi:DNA polymerase III delta prime subunit
MDLMKDTPRPLVLAFTGPTGVGKTETAHVIARAMLPKTELVGVGRRPRGLLVLRGEDFADVNANVTR